MVSIPIMTLYFNLLLTSFFMTTSCNTGQLDAIADLPSSLKETSAIEIVKGQDILWIIEDAGNKNHLYGLDTHAEVIKNISIDNVQNTDWEDLTSDADGTIYIGDFGNNSKKRKNFAIYKVPHPEDANSSTNAEVISFRLPKGMKSEDFESFFLYKNAFYLFSKSNKNCKLFKVPNAIDHHVAEFISEIELDGKHTKVTSADISDDGKTVVLLNHDKLWKLTNYTDGNFFNGDVKAISFNHSTQKEGINLIGSNKVLITDERNKSEGGNIYSFSFD